MEVALLIVVLDNIMIKHLELSYYLINYKRLAFLVSLIVTSAIKQINALNVIKVILLIQQLRHVLIIVYTIKFIFNYNN